MQDAPEIRAGDDDCLPVREWASTYDVQIGPMIPVQVVEFAAAARLKL